MAVPRTSGVSKRTDWGLPVGLRHRLLRVATRQWQGSALSGRSVRVDEGLKSDINLTLEPLGLLLSARAAPGLFG